MRNLYAPFGIMKVRRKIGYCNVNVIPLLKELGIDWDMDTRRIIFCGRVFPMKDIDSGEAEEFISSLVGEDGQCSLDLFR